MSAKELNQQESDKESGELSSLDDEPVVEAPKEKVEEARSAEEEGELGEVEPGEEPSEKATGQQTGDNKSHNAGDA